MIRIALLDDEKDQREVTAALLERYFSQHPELSAQVRPFQSGFELLDAVERSGSFDLYLLDIVMPEQNGIEVGLSIRKLDGLGLIVYLTTSPDYAVDSYLTNAFHYLLKPVRWEQMVSVLDRAMDILARRQELGVMVRTKGAHRRVLHSELQYGSCAAAAYTTISPAARRWRASACRSPSGMRWQTFWRTPLSCCVAHRTSSIWPL